MKHKKSFNRKPQGVSIFLVVASAALITALIVGSFQIMLIFNANQSIDQQVDAGALNVAKRVPEVTVPAPPIFNDCAGRGGQISVTNLSRVEGKAYLVNKNEEAMTADGEATDDSTRNAEQIHNEAQETNDALYHQLTSPAVLAHLFDALGVSGVRAFTEHGWETAYLNRGGQSNLTFDPKQFPGTNVSATPVNGTTPVNGSGSGNSGSFFPGYVPLNSNGMTFYFIPFKGQEMPHLIGGDLFTTNQGSPGGITNPIPNAFSAFGEAHSGSGTPLSAIAYAVANPQRQYRLAIPHAFISIQLENKAKWYVNNDLVKTTSYGFSSETQNGVKDYPLQYDGKLNGYASLGNEFGGGAGTIWQGLTSLPGNYQQALNKMVQRIQEVKSDFTLADLQSLLQKQQLKKSTSEYLIYPTYASADLTDPVIQITPAGQQSSTWLKLPRTLDGSQHKILDQGPLQDYPNYCWDMVTGSSCHDANHYTKLTGEVLWQPGTGFDQCLGELTINHITECHFEVECAPPSK
jgi:hypothetical protein